ncbi:MAG: 3-phosphoglycerate dehydrogenase [Bacteroidales bacterium]|nr:3-phosphoglycerate dehydrogenase [Bacteroidales bacterium]
MKKILVLTVKPFAKAAVDGIKETVKKANCEFALLEKYESQDEMLTAVKNANALIIRSDKITKEVMDAAPNLEIVARAGSGYDNVDLATATEKGIVVMNTPGQNANAVAELVIGMMIYKARNFFNGKPGTELKDKTLGLHAFGNVAQEVARIAKGIGMEIYAFDPFLTDEQISSKGVTPLHSVEELYSKSQFVSLHIPAVKETIQSVNYDLLSKMPAKGVLVNAARKEVIHEDDMIRFMTEHEDFTYLSDIAPDNKTIFEEKFEGRYYFSPKKMGAQTAEANINAGLAAANQIKNFFENGDTKFKVN